MAAAKKVGHAACIPTRQWREHLQIPRKRAQRANRGLLSAYTFRNSLRIQDGQSHPAGRTPPTGVIQTTIFETVAAYRWNGPVVTGVHLGLI